MDAMNPTRPSPYWTFRVPFLLKLMQHLSDVFVLILAFESAYQLRFDFAVPPADVQRALLQLPYVIVIQLVAIRLSGVQTFIWRYIGMLEIRSFVAAALGWTIPLLVLRFGLPASAYNFRVPLSVIVMDTVIGFVGLIGV